MTLLKRLENAAREWDRRATESVANGYCLEAREIANLLEDAAKHVRQTEISERGCHVLEFK